MKIQVDYEVAQKVGSDTNPESVRASKYVVYDNLIDKLSSDDLAKQWSIHANLEKDETLRDVLRDQVAGDPNYYQEAYKKMSKLDRTRWDEASMFGNKEAQAQAQENKEMRDKVRAIKEKHRKA